MPTLTIRPLAPECLGDFLGFFEGAAFADNPGWRSCYCQYMYVDHSKVRWETRTGDENRASACDRIGSGRMHGLLAYRDGEVVGWCNAGPRSLLEALAADTDRDAEHLGQITCFVIAPEHRRTGVARALLGAACDALREQGFTTVEARPSRAASNAAENYHGPVALYEAAGFVVVAEREDGSLVMRRALR